ncbi:MAG: transporter substrate-binding domain-containing protein [Sneathiella sp.]|nr:transporter substrate-binding domain-containing protein [Sneathiella sp.]
MQNILSRLTSSTFSLLSLICFLWMFVFASSASSKESVIIAGPADYPPYSYMEKNEPKGFYIQILKEVFAQLEDYDVQIELVPWKRALEYVETGHYLAVFPPYKWPEQRPWIKYYSEPILIERVAVYCRKEVLKDQIRRSWPQDYFGLTVGTDLGNLSAGVAFFKAVEAGKISLLEMKLEKSISRVLLGEISCFVQDPRVLNIYFDRYAKQKSLENSFSDFLSLGTIISNNWGYLGYSDLDEKRFPFKWDFIKKVDAIIQKMKNRGRIKEIVESYQD